MRRVTIIMMAILAFTAFSYAQDDDGYTMFENTRFVVKSDKFKEFGEAMAKHNKDFHADGAYHANVWSVTVGANSGQFVWSMGPCTYTELDGRPSGEDHMKDWLGSVMPNIKILETNYWKMDEKGSYNPGEVVNSKLSIRVFDIEDFQSYRFKEIMSKVIKVYTEKEYDRTIATYWAQFDVNADEDVAIVWGFDKWASFDEDPKFKDDYEEVHGEGSWWKFREELRGVIKGSQDEIWEIVPSLSGSGE